MNKETLKFICWITGHDEETIKQMYRDYSSSPQAKSIPMQLPVKPANGGLEEILKDWAKQFEFNYIPITAKKIIEDRKNLIITTPENLIFALLHATKFEIKEDSRLSV